MNRTAIHLLAPWKPGLPSMVPPRAPMSLGQAQGSPLGAVVLTDLLAVGISSATAYVGIHTGVKEAGVLSVLGWVVGVAGVLGSFGTLATLIQDVASMSRAPMTAEV